MGQKVHPIGIRLGIVEEARSTWYAKKADFADYLMADVEIRRCIKQLLANKGAAVSRVQIERQAKNTNVTIHSARPGVIIGRKGDGVEHLREAISKRVNLPIHLTIQEVKKPDVEAVLVAESIAQQLEKRVSFRRAVKRAMQTTMRQGAKGVKISVSGRLGGAEIARREWQKEGRIPLHTLRANIDYGTARSETTYGVIGVKVWIYKGEKLKPRKNIASTENAKEAAA